MAKRPNMFPDKPMSFMLCHPGYVSGLIIARGVWPSNAVQGCWRLADMGVKGFEIAYPAFPHTHADGAVIPVGLGLPLVVATLLHRLPRPVDLAAREAMDAVNGGAYNGC